MNYLRCFNSFSIDEALHSDNIVIKAYAMLDRRVGIRRLKSRPDFYETKLGVMLKGF